MVQEFKLPEIGEGVVEGEIVRWLVQPGQAVVADDPVVEVMTDKATVEVAISAGGTISVLKAAEGDIVPVGGVLLVLDGDGTTAVQAPSKPEESTTTFSEPPKPPPPEERAPPVSRASEPPPAKPQPQPVSLDMVRAARGTAAPEKVLASPAARAVARERGVDIESVPGTGPSGRVLPGDVVAAAGGLRSASGSPAVAGGGGGFRALTDDGAIQRHSMRGLRKRIAEAMVSSKTTIPHFTYVDEVDMGAIVELRNSLKAEAKEQGVALSYLSFVGLAVRRAMEDFPEINSHHDDETGEIVQFPELHLGISVDTPRGLYVAVVHDVGQYGVIGLAQAIQDVVSRVRDGKATSEELTGSTFTITSVGNIGGLFATPVINKPEVAILGMNRVVERPVVRDGRVVVRPMAYLSPSFDHRVIDGAVGARFVARLKQLLENPARIFMAEG